MEIKTIDLLKEGTLLPPAEGKCQECGREHPKEYPHDHTSLYYQMSFKKKHDRWPTLDDAMEHCAEDMKELWPKAVKKTLKEWKDKKND